MKKNQVGGILILVILISFICGTVGSFFILNSLPDDNDNNIVVNHSGVVLTESDSISKGVDNIYDAVVVVEGFKNSQLASTGTGFIYKKNKDKAR